MGSSHSQNACQQRHPRTFGRFHTWVHGALVKNTELFLWTSDAPPSLCSGSFQISFKPFGGVVGDFFYSFFSTAKNCVSYSIDAYSLEGKL